MYKFDLIEERDVDFVVMRAFAELPIFADYFLSKENWQGADIVSIEHSYTDPEFGESDITVIVRKDDKKYGLLIENKIDAKAMPEQCSRYHKRGELGQSNNAYDDYTVFLIAPKAYIDTNSEAKKYDNKVSYEEILNLFDSLDKPFDSAIIKNAITKQAKGYTVREVPAITSFWHHLYDFCSVSDKQIEMYPISGPKGAHSTWVQFKSPLKGTWLYYKSNLGVVDLEFTGKQPESARLKTDLYKFLSSNMHWTNTGKSLSLRIKCNPMDFKKPFEHYSFELIPMLDAVEKLTSLATKLNDIGYII